MNALTAAQAVIIPMQCEYYALEGLTDLVGTLRKVKANLNPDIEIEALVRTMYDLRSSLTTQSPKKQEPLWRQGVRHRDPAQHPHRRGALLRQAGDPARRRQQGRASALRVRASCFTRQGIPFKGGRMIAPRPRRGLDALLSGGKPDTAKSEGQLREVLVGDLTH